MDRRNLYQHHLHPQQQFQPQPQTQNATVDPGGGERLPQWSVQETKEMLGIREELDQMFMETKRNKLLWEVVASKMSDKGFVRTADQCKSKWKNLVTRFKGCETTEPEALRQQFPFYNEIQTIFAGRMQRMLWSEPNTSKRKHQISSEDDDDEEADNDDDDHHHHHEIGDELQTLVETHQKGTIKMASNARKRGKKVKGDPTNTTTGSVKEVLEEFMRQMVKIEREWKEVYEERERERVRREREWRRRMMELEEERVAAERLWMEKEEERRLREEIRAQKRDALIDALLRRLN